MRQFIKTKDSTHPSQNDRFFDSVAFWQAAHEKSEAEQTKLLDRIYELEQRNEILAAKAGIGTDGNRVELGNGKRGNTATSGTKTGPRKRMKMLAGGGVQGPGEEYSEEGECGLLFCFWVY